MRVPSGDCTDICFNRTFMELKYLDIFGLDMTGYVLIVPLWN